ncbi:ABC transporter family substrate-binding protein [Streptomyces sp. NPDC092296]|uniref:ABC transporter family substrate-binding protein n=1 Tax=Streptomyces sp. NPDC092296 TaxID=3366012 RepID=UPI00382A9DCA
MPITQDVQEGSPASGRTAIRRHPARHAGTAALVLTAVLGVGLAACSGSAPGPVASDVPTADRADLREGGTLRWAVDSVPTTLNVFQADATADSTLVARAVLPTLFRLDDRARPTPDPDYLAAADATAPSPAHPRQTVVYRLNPKAVWSDGTPLSAADFAAQWQALRGADSAYWTDHAAGYSAIESVTPGADPHQVKVVFKQPYAPWKGLFSPLYPAAAMRTPAAFNDGSKDGLATSAGPFRVDRLDRDAGSVTLVRNPSWWGDRAKLERVELLAVPTGKRLDALAHGRLDVAALDREADSAPAVPDTPAGQSAAPAADAAGATVAATRSLLDQAAALPGFRLRRASGAAYTQVTLNGGSGPLADARVRRAVAAALDRQRIADAVLKPLGLPAVPLGNHLLMGDQDGYRDNTAALGRTGDKAAAEQLESAGWRMGTPTAGTPTAGTPSASALPAALASAASPVPGSAAARVKDGRPLSLNVLIPAGSATARRIARVIGADLAKIGIVTVPRAVDGDGFFTDHVAAGDFDLAVFSWPASANTVADERPLYAKPQPGPDGLPMVGLNFARTGTDEIDRLLDRAAATLDPAAATRLTQQADTRIWELAPSVPLFQRPEIVAVRDGLVGVGAFGFATPRFQDMGYTLTS